MAVTNMPADTLSPLVSSAKRSAPRTERTKRPRVAYLLASSHSGSTLLAMLLGAHPNARTIGELKLKSIGNLNGYLCSCGSPIIRCPFWSQVHERMQQRCDFSLSDSGTSVHQCSSDYTQRLLGPVHHGAFWEAIRDTALALSPTWRRHLARVKFNYKCLVETALELTAADIIVDSSKQGVQLKYLLQIPDLDIKVVRVIRDGRAVALTGMDGARFADATDPKLRYGGTGMKDDFPGYTMAQAARVWRRSNEEADCLLANLDRHQWTEVRYEQLCKNPKQTLASVYEFLELDSTKLRMDFRSVEHHVVGNGMRFDSTSEVRLDERWRTHLSAEDLRQFDEVAGDLNCRYGYV
jgi:hypothetical protein